MSPSRARSICGVWFGQVLLINDRCFRVGFDTRCGCRCSFTFTDLLPIAVETALNDGRADLTEKRSPSVVESAQQRSLLQLLCVSPQVLVVDDLAVVVVLDDRQLAELDVLAPLHGAVNDDLVLLAVANVGLEWVVEGEELLERSELRLILVDAGHVSDGIAEVYRRGEVREDFVEFRVARRRVV